MRNLPLLALLAVGVSCAAAAASPEVRFGLYTAQGTPPPGWSLATVEQLNALKPQFVAYYNAHRGLPVVKTFSTTNCCVAVAGGAKLTVGGTRNGVAFPANSAGKLHCNPSGGYVKDSVVAFYEAPTLSLGRTLGSRVACSTKSNPGVFVWTADTQPDLSHLSTVQLEQRGIRFALGDLHEHPGGDWQLLSIADLQARREEFIEAYNKNGGLSVVKVFRSGNCCIALKGGMKLTIAGSRYGFQFPSDTEQNGVVCNPAAGYQGKLQLLKLPRLGLNQAFTQRAACATNHNPALYALPPPTVAHDVVEFGMYDLMGVPPGKGWELSSVADINAHKAAFVRQYNQRGGLTVIQPFSSINCCVALKGGKKIVVSGSKFNVQFPSDATTGGIRCNPTGGYVAGAAVGFYLLKALTPAHTFTEVVQCATNHNPSIYIRRVVTAPTPAPTAAPTTAPTNAPTPAAVHCAVGEWSSWSICTKRCGGGAQTRGRKVLRHAAHGGYVCPSTAEERGCNAQVCPAHCTVSKWGAWGQCSTSCGQGARVRERSIISAAAGGGTECPMLTNRGNCNDQDCPQHCELSEWSKWSACNADCGGGVQLRARLVLTPPSNDGDRCAHLSESRICNSSPCPLHCATSPWSDWTPCNAACGGGSSLRTRVVTVDPQFNGQSCPHLEETRACASHPCPLHCETSEWGGWRTCNVVCGGGLQERHRSIVTAAQFDGNDCAALVNERACNTMPCPVDCKVPAWDTVAWGACTRSCGGGTQLRFRKPHKVAQHGGAECPTEMEQRRACNTDACPINCDLSEWSGWTTCTRSCGAGTSSRSRSVVAAAALGGTCAHLGEQRPCNLVACPSDCVHSRWTPFSECSASCATGTRTRTRNILAQPVHGGKACGAKAERQSCDAGPCPVHCSVSTWGSWATCSHTCGEGVMVRERRVLSHAEHGGYVCPSLTDGAPCTMGTCPVHCVASAWTAWTACSASACGGGMQIRNRSVIRQAAHAGLPCSHNQEWRACNTKPCILDCGVTGWSDDSRCNKSCGGGRLSRTRRVTQPPMHGGAPCPALEEHGSCNEHSCPEDCDMTVWGGWGACTKTCNGGTTTRIRSVVSEPTHGGALCSALEQTRPCDTDKCPIHCDVSAWGGWGDCTKSCGTGKESRTRSVVRHAAHGGYSCPSLSDVRDCSVNHCPADCSVGEWSAWAACSQTCGEGQQERSRSIVSAVAYGGKACPPEADTRPCKSETPCPVIVPTPAPVDCHMGAWGAWTSCSITCGSGGRHQRSRSVLSPASHGGTACSADLLEDGVCEPGPCPIHCTVSAWSAWAACSKTCGGGTAARSRSVVSHADHGGYTCPSLSQDRACNIADCAVDCIVGSWASWQGCSATCGGGHESRFRKMTTPAMNGGKACPNYSHIRNCGKEECPVHCDLADWSHWGECDRTCGTGSQSRSRKIVSMSQHGGLCADRSDHRPCNTAPCALDCEMQPWQIWSECTATCGKGTKTRVREASRLPAFGGKPCPALREHFVCDAGPCAVNCEVSTWNRWDACSKTCGIGTQRRTRFVTRHADAGGYECPALKETRECNNGACPAHCAVSAWGEWTTCSATCGGGSQSRSRSVLRTAAHGGNACPALDATQACATWQCQINCQVSTWSAWTSCSTTCGGGVATRSRNVVQIAKWDGHHCPSLGETRDCNVDACAVDCDVYDWAPFSACSRTCGEGVKSRTRGVRHMTAFGGKPCPPLEEHVACNAGKCPINCEVTSWQPWTQCTRTCGVGTHGRHRTVLRHSERGGYVCPALFEREQCELSRCPVDCVARAWGTWSACSRSCGSGASSRSRTVSRNAADGGEKCPPLSQTQTCNATPCPVDCVASAWEPWGPCSGSCGTGVRTRKRRFGWLTKPSYGGKACPELTRTETCDAGLCPVHCMVSSFSPWTDCSVTCGGGTQKRGRSVVQLSVNGGTPCPLLAEQRDCSTSSCPKPCVVASWQPWSDCSQTCGAGVRTRIREQLAAAEHGGDCAALSETAACRVRGCPVACEVTSWNAWSACNQPCGGGRQSRSMSVVVEAAFGGTACPSLMGEVRLCNTRHCTRADFDQHKQDREAGLLKVAARYEVKVETGMHQNSGSETPIALQFIGTHGRSREYELGTSFARGRSDLLKIMVREDIGNLYMIVLKAKGLDGWNPVNFIDVMTPRGHHVQFRANLFIDGKPHDHPVGLAYGLFPVKEEARLTAVVPEGAQDVEPMVYVVKHTTGSAPDAGSESAMYMQVHGSAGKSNFYLLGKSFTAGHVETTRIVTREMIGLVNRITLQAGGADNWYTADAIEVTAESGQHMRFDTNFYLGEQGGANTEPVPVCKARAGTVWAMCGDKEVAKWGIGPEGKAKAIKNCNYASSTNRKYGTCIAATSGAHTYFEKEVMAEQPERPSLVPIPQLTLALKSVHLSHTAITADGGARRTLLLNAAAHTLGVHPSSQRLSVVTMIDNLHLYKSLGLQNELEGVVLTFSYRAKNVEDAKTMLAKMTAKGFAAAFAAQAEKDGVHMPDHHVTVGISELVNGAPLAAWGQLKAAYVTKPPTTGVDWDKAALDYDLRDGTSSKGYDAAKARQEAAKAAAVRATPSPTPPPTPLPTLAIGSSCAYGTPQSGAKGEVQSWVPSGWSGAGHGADYCRRCHCKDGALRCDSKKCGYPWHGDVPDEAKGAKVCSHTKCKWSDWNRARITTHHSKAEQHGGNHRCAYNVHSDVCTCLCWGAKRLPADYYARRARGRATFVPLFVSEQYQGLNHRTQCNYVNFERTFNPIRGAVRVIVTPTMIRSKDKTPLIWVESSSLSSFKVCAREFSTNPNEKLRPFSVDWTAFQFADKTGLSTSVDTPWGGAQSSTAQYVGKTSVLHDIGENGGGGGRNCKIVPFAKRFDRVPMVVGSIDRQIPAGRASRAPRLPVHYAYNGVGGADSGHTRPGESGVLAAWVERVDAASFEVCFHAAKPEAAAAVELDDELDAAAMAVNFNWIAIEHENPALWYNEAALPYSAAGHAPGGTWDVSTHQTDGVTLYENCRAVPFRRSFAVMPTLLVTANHAEGAKAADDWSSPVHHPAALVVDKVTPKGFRVCALETGRSAAAPPRSDIFFDFVAFADDSLANNAVHSADGRVVAWSAAP